MRPSQYKESCKQTAIDFCEEGSGVKEHINAMDSGVFRLLGPRRSRAKIPHKISRDNTVQP
jgi:hypothetical protein